MSTKSTETLVSILKIKAVEDLFSLAIGGGSVTSHKPDPEGLLWGIERLGLERKDVLYCGDTVIDAETAKNAGTDFCAVLNGTTPAQAFQAWPSVHISPDLHDLKTWLGV